jgi:hypothetical protein
MDILGWSWGVFRLLGSNARNGNQPTLCKSMGEGESSPFPSTHSLILQCQFPLVFPLGDLKHWLWPLLNNLTVPQSLLKGNVGC